MNCQRDIRDNDILDLECLFLSSLDGMGVKASGKPSMSEFSLVVSLSRELRE